MQENVGGLDGVLFRAHPSPHRIRGVQNVAHLALNLIGVLDNTRAYFPNLMAQMISCRPTAAAGLLPSALDAI